MDVFATSPGLVLSSLRVDGGAALHQPLAAHYAVIRASILQREGRKTRWNSCLSRVKAKRLLNRPVFTHMLCTFTHVKCEDFSETRF